MEKSIVICHPDERRVCNAVLALHFLLRPLEWVSASISFLPPSLSELLSAPSPILIGAAHLLQPVGPGFVCLDLARPSLAFGDAAVPSSPRFRGTSRKCGG
jgi:hypothetical protein